ncbi:MAG: DnaA/Hda family protein [Hyphomicrobiaceae bacterium]
MSTPAEQLILDLSLRPALGAEDFIVSASNEAALALIDSWPDWPSPVAVVAGPKGSGKTHLAQVFRHRSGAGVVSAHALDDDEARRLGEGRAAVVEDADRGILSEKAFFHLINLAREQGGHILVTGQTPPGQWSIALPDLRSRLRAAPVVQILPPDDALLRAVLVKLLSDRQLPATPHAVTHLARHMERSMEAALGLVEEIDRMLWQRPREVSRDVAREALQRIGGEGDGS